MDHIRVFKNSVNKPKFLSFLDDLKRKFPFDQMILVMDNLSVHKCRDVKNRM